jgi:EpsI family protein
MGRSKQLVLYWYTAGDIMVASYSKQQIYFLLDEIRYHKSRGALVRVSTMVINEDIKDAFRRLEDFIQISLPSYL